VCCCVSFSQCLNLSHSIARTQQPQCGTLTQLHRSSRVQNTQYARRAMLQLAHALDALPQQRSIVSGDAHNCHTSHTVPIFHLHRLRNVCRTKCAELRRHGVTNAANEVVARHGRRRTHAPLCLTQQIATFESHHSPATNKTLKLAVHYCLIYTSMNTAAPLEAVCAVFMLERKSAHAHNRTP
jgi:hypothetical protein